MDGDGPEWFSGPNILEILQHFRSNLLNFDHQRFLCSGHTHILPLNSQKIVSERLKTKIKKSIFHHTSPKCHNFIENLIFWQFLGFIDQC